jgi:hypothetical protein
VLLPQGKILTSDALECDEIGTAFGERLVAP